MPKPSKDTKRIMYIGYPGDSGSPFSFHGSIDFPPRTVVPVSDELYECVRHIHKFVTVDAVSYNVLDFPNRIGSVANVSEFFETENTMV